MSGELTERIFINPNGHNVGMKLLEILSCILKDYEWKSDTLNPRIYANPAIWVRSDQKRDVIKSLEEKGLFSR